MKKRIYRSVAVGQVATDRVVKGVGGQKVVVGIDVAKEDFFAALTNEAGETVETIKWKHPMETRLFVEFLKGLPARQIEVALESSGTYGEALKEQLWRAEISVFEVSTKRVHDAQEVYDGVPSTHDPKCAAIIAKLHRDGASHRWQPASPMRRKLRAMVRTLDLYQDQVGPLRGRLEALLAMYWPEVSQHLDLDSATLLELLTSLGGPAKIAAQPLEAQAVMKRIGKNFLKLDTITKVIECARHTVGIEILPEEEESLKIVAREIRRALNEVTNAKAQVRALTENEPVVQHLRPLLGHVTAAVLICVVGDPNEFQSAAALVKATGLNLKVHSSGKHKGKLRISKRGSGIARKYLYMAALRAIQRHPVVKAWYDRKVARDGGVKGKAIIAIMRKLQRAAFHVARGAQFDERKLFDTRLLEVAQAA